MNNEKIVTVRLPERLSAELGKISRREYRSKAGQLTAFLEKAIEEYWAENDQQDEATA